MPQRERTPLALVLLPALGGSRYRKTQRQRKVEIGEESWLQQGIISKVRNGVSCLKIGLYEVWSGENEGRGGLRDEKETGNRRYDGFVG